MAVPRNGDAGPAVVVTGVGVISPLGSSAQELFQRLLQGETALRLWQDLQQEGYRCAIAARVTQLEADSLRRGRAFALAAAEQAVAQCGTELPPGTGAYIGSTLGESAAFERAAEGALIDLQDYGVPSFTRSVCHRFGLIGPVQSLVTACAAGNYAVGAALDDLRRGRVDFALAGGVEPFSRLSLVGFSRSRAMASEHCRPFDASRNGMLLGEGAAMFVLERADQAHRRGAKPLAEVVSLGLSCDAHHPTAPLADGSGMRRAMQLALEAADVDVGVVDWVNAHGSGTRVSDAAEARALHDLFRDTRPVVSASKGALGHSLGASSAIELAICVQGLRQQTVPPTAGHESPDPDGGIACSREPVRRPLQWVLNNAFAFGGLNSSLLLRACEP